MEALFIFILYIVIIADLIYTIKMAHKFINQDIRIHLTPKCKIMYMIYSVIIYSTLFITYCVTGNALILGAIMIEVLTEVISLKCLHNRIG